MQPNPSRSLTPFLLAFACLSLLNGAIAQTADTTKIISEARAEAQEKRLWENPEWLKLLHYKKSGNSTNSLLSQVDDQRFFLAPDGKTDPEAELMVTLSALYDAPTVDDAHPQCRFPARHAWLQQQLGNTLSSPPEPSCPRYKEWRASIPDQQLALIFPAYHLNSPSSMFGHTLLRLDPANVSQHSEWLSIAVNFGADVNADDSSLFYALNGLTGGYPGFFIVGPYFKKIREYLQDENRDMWEYHLNLRPDEIKRMVTHLWELKEIKFDYYFFDENCSYRLLELLEVARPGIQLTDEFSFTVIPVDTVRAVEKAGLVESVAYRPSQVTVLENLLLDIPASSRTLIKEIAQDPEKTRSSEFQSLSHPAQRNVVEAAYKLLRYEHGSGPREPVIAKQRYRLLEQLNAYPASESPSIDSNNRPESGHLSRRVSIGAGQRSDAPFIDLAYRMSFHSLEDNAKGFLQGAQINLGNLQFRIYEDETPQVRQFDVVDIFSITPRSTLFTPVSWRVYAGLERQPTRNEDVLTAHVTGGGGVSYALTKNNMTYALAGLRLEKNRLFSTSITPALTALFGTLHHFEHGTAHLQLGADEFSNHETRYRASYIHNVVLDTQHSIKLNVSRLHHENSRSSEASLSYQYYF